MLGMCVAYRFPNTGNILRRVIEVFRKGNGESNNAIVILSAECLDPVVVNRMNHEGEARVTLNGERDRTH